MTNISVEIGGIKWKSPVSVASGTFGYGDEFDFYDVNQLGAIFTKSVTPERRIGNLPQRIAEVENGMLNAIGLANIGLDEFIAEKIPFYHEMYVPIYVNVAGKTVEDYKKVIAKLEKFAVIAGFEINISCPNVTAGGIEFGKFPDSCGRLIDDLRPLTEKPLFVKLSPNVADIAEIAKSAENSGADAITAINTLYGMAIDLDRKKSVLSTKIGGYSGSAVKPHALAQVYKCIQSVKIPVIGVGGISNLHDVMEFLLIGARAVQMGTVNFVNPMIALDITNAMSEFLEKRNVSCVTEWIGSLEN